MARDAGKRSGKSGGDVDWEYGRYNDPHFRFVQNRAAPALPSFNRLWDAVVKDAVSTGNAEVSCGNAIASASWGYSQIRAHWYLCRSVFLYEILCSILLAASQEQWSQS